MPDKAFQQIAVETNRYSQDWLEEEAENLPARSPARQWKETSAGKLKYVPIYNQVQSINLNFFSNIKKIIPTGQKQCHWILRIYMYAYKLFQLHICQFYFILFNFFNFLIFKENLFTW